jgi:hypothetical protein
MELSAGPIATYRRYWLPELVVLVSLTIVAVVLFSATSLDIETVRPFYHHEHEDPWPDKEQPLWSLCYKSAHWVTASLAVAGVAMFVLGIIREGSKRMRWYGVFVLICVILGPGLIINLVLKDHWGRPRPRQIVEFGGRYEYVQPFVPATNSIKALWDFDALPVPILRYRVTLVGWFMDIDGTALIRIPVKGLHRITIRLRHGDIHVVFETHRNTSRGTPMLDLQTRHGRVFQSPQ